MKRILTIFLEILFLAVLACSTALGAGKTVNVTGVTIDKTSLVLTVGEQATLTANIFPAKATNPSVKWLTSNNDVATVNETGIVSAVSPGVAKITVKTVDGGYEAACVVKVDIVSNVETGEATDLTSFSAKISGKANLAAYTSEDMMIGVLYSTYAGVLPQSSQNAVASGFDAEYRFTVNVEPLLPETKYYYRSYIRQYGLVVYGPTREFDTPACALEVTLGDVTAITELKATLNGQINVTDRQSKDRQVSFFYSETASSAEDLIAKGVEAKASLSETGVFSAGLSSLKANTEYHYVACATVCGKTVFSGVNKFTTKDFTLGIETDNVKDVSDDNAVVNGRLTVTSVDLLEEDVKILYSQTAKTIDDLKNKGIPVSASLDSGAFSCVIPSLSGNTTYYYVACATVCGKIVFSEIRTFKTMPTQDWVDLGLSVKWRKYNLGATKPEDCGNFYAWSETIVKQNYNWSTHKWCNGSEYSLTKYNNNKLYGKCDNKGKLDLADDVAHVKLGGKWRMPTIVEYDELLSNTTIEWAEINGVSGCKFTSTKPGYTDKWIFLPASGYRSDMNLKDGNIGHYWSSSLNAYGAIYARGLYFNSEKLNLGDSPRCLGYLIRPVLE